MAEPKCDCEGGTKLVFACSGSSDVGELTDKVARKLSREGAATMSCLAGIGGEISGFVASAQGADITLVLDGCPQDCGRKTMERSGVKGFKYLRVTDIGFKKGKTPVNEKNMETIYGRAKELLG